MALDVFATFLLAHLIADFPLQTNSMVRLKQKGSLGIFLHVSIHVVVAGILFNQPFAKWQLFLLLSCLHWIIDWTKIALGSNSVGSFIFDQAAHVISLVVIVMVASTLNILPTPRLEMQFLYPAIAYAMLLAFMVFIWVWANHQSPEVASNRPLVRWAQRSMLGFSQRAGLALIGGVGFNIMSSW